MGGYRAADPTRLGSPPARPEPGASVGERLWSWGSHVPGAALAYRWVHERRVRAGQRRAIARNGTVVRVDFGGSSIDLDLRELHDCEVLHALESGRGYEPETTALLEERLGPGQCFIDGGANNGLYSVLAARRVGPSGRVLGFEPNPSAFRRLVHNVQVNGFADRVRAMPQALGASAGAARLFLSETEDGLSSLVRPSERAIVVPAVTLDASVGDARVDLVKIDVEGAELPALRGMERTIARNPDIGLVVEWHPKYAGPGLWEFLAARFRIFRIRAGSSRGSYRLAPLRSYSDTRGLPVCNLWCEARTN
jgi:FkbM family methyltransferase